MKNELKALTMERRLRADRLHRKAQPSDMPDEKPARPTAALKTARAGARKAAIALAPATTTV